MDQTCIFFCSCITLNVDIICSLGLKILESTKYGSKLIFEKLYVMIYYSQFNTFMPEFDNVQVVSIYLV